MKKKFFVLLLALCMVVSMTSVSLAASEPAGTLGTGVVFTPGDTGADDGSYIYFDISGLSATTSIEIKLYSGETLLSSTVLNQTGKDRGYLALSSLSAKVEITDDSSSWDTTWEVAPVSSIVPDKAVLFVDGAEQNSVGVNMYNTDYPDRAREWGDIEGVAAPVYIDETGYDTLAAAIAAASEKDTITIKADGTYTLAGFGKELTIEAAEGIKATIDVANAVTLSGAKVTFENLTFDYYPNKTYTGLQHTNTVTYNGCTINGQIFLYANTETFNDCTFNQESADAYNVWTYGAKTVEFNSCVFNCAGKSVLVYNEGATGTALTVADCEFIASSSAEGKAAIEIDSQYLSVAEGEEHSVTISDSTAAGFDEGSVSGSTLYNNKKGQLAEVTVDGEKVLEIKYAASIGETVYLSLQEALNAAAAGEGAVTVEILSDIDLDGIDWVPVTVSAPHYPQVTVNGNDHIISNLNDMLFAGTWAGNSALIINDLTIADSNIQHDLNDELGNVGVGAFIGYPQASATITLNNCHLTNSTVSGGHWTGGLVGMAGGYNGNDGPVFMDLTITGCSVTDSTITGKGSVGGVIGHGSCAAWTKLIITDTTVTNNTITSTGDATNKAGVVMGTIGAAGQPTTAAGETKTGGAEVSVTESGNTVSSSGTAITTVYGRQGTETGVLIVTGGSYANYPIEEDVSYAAPKEGYVIVSGIDGEYILVEGTSSANVSFKVSPDGAEIVIKDGTGSVIASGGEGDYVLLSDATYTYTVSKSGYNSITGTVTVAGEDQIVEVTLYPIIVAPSNPAKPEEPVEEDCTGGETCPAYAYTDVDTALWYHEAIDYALTEGLFNGMTDTEFAPNGQMTRAMFWTVLARSAGVEVSGTGNDWYEAAMNWVIAQGISDGTMANEAITREQIVTMLWRYAGSPESEGSLEAYTDAAAVSAWAAEAMQWAVENGVVGGYENGTLCPTCTASRAEVAQLMMNYLSK